MEPLSRRRFLIAGAGAGLALAAACGGDDQPSTAPLTSDRTEGPEPDQLTVLVASAQVLAGEAEERFTFGLLEEAAPVDATEVEVAFGRTLETLGDAVAATRHAEGIEERPYYRADFAFPEAGEWWVEARVGEKAGAMPFPVVSPDDTEVPQVGEALIPVVTPTPADPRGVNPICTRQPVCPLHDVTLQAALGEGRPLAVLFSTPALCQSQVCGPVLEILLEALPSHAERIRFVHVEVYTSLQAQFRSEDLTEGMRAYHLTFEPVLFLAGGDGIITEIIDGPFDRTEAGAALRRLAG